MSFKDLIVISRGTKKILAITLSVATLAVVFAFFYYRGVNRLEDPRVSGARILMAEYDRVAGGTGSSAFFHLLDSAGRIYRSVPGYETSWETGVIYNNKCSGLLLMALYDSTVAGPVKQSLLELAVIYCDSSITVYKRWLSEWEGLTDEEVSERVLHEMDENDPAFSGLNFRKLSGKRVRDVMLARIETPRRLSVSYTNKATAYRHLMLQDSALIYYERALALWRDNRTAESNLSVLLGGEPVKPGLIKSLFPPDRKKK
jgi:hypothetical protein